MMNLEKLEGKDIYTFSIVGDIDEKGVKDFYDLLELKSGEHEKIKVLGVIDHFPGFKNLKSFSTMMSAKFKALRAIGKYAILSDENWIRILLPVGDFLTPGQSIKAFKLTERAEAIAWLEHEEIKDKVGADDRKKEV